MPETLKKLGNTPDLQKLGPGAHKDGGGLWLIATETSASWTLRFTLLNGKPGKMGLGSINEVSAPEARDRRHEALKVIAQGKDPREVRLVGGVVVEKDKRVPLFLPFAIEFLARQTFKNDKKTRTSWQTVINKHCFPLHKKPIDQITTKDVVAIVSPLWKATPAIVRNVLSCLNMILKSARALGHMDENRAIVSEMERVAAGVGSELQEKGTVKHGHAEMPYQDMPAFWCELRAIDSIASKNLQLQILTCVRPGEASQATFAQIKKTKHEAGARGWFIPGHVMKHAKNITAEVPLSPTALAIVAEMEALRAQGERDTLLFPGCVDLNKEQNEMAVLKLLQTTLGYNGEGDKPKVTRHGFRASFRTWGDEETEHSDTTLEYCLHHIKGDAAKKAYQRGTFWKKRKAALLDWEAFVTSEERARNAEREKIQLKIAA